MTGGGGGGPGAGRTSSEALRRTIYLSSTYADMAKARRAVADAIERLQGHTVVGMESYLASDERPVDRCLADVATCDYYVGLFAWRYGFVPLGETRSITELELREAIRSNKPRLLFVLDERAKWPAGAVDADPERIKALRAELLETHLVSVFKSASDLPLLASIAVANQTMLELRGVRSVAHQELSDGLRRLYDVLLFLALLPYIGSRGPRSTPIPGWMRGGGRFQDLDLADTRVLETLRATSISPPRPLNGPYAQPVPFGTDRRATDAIVSDAASAVETLLRSALARYSAAELGVEAMHGLERVLEHSFLRYLEGIRESAATRRHMEDSKVTNVPILDSGIIGGSTTDYLDFLQALEALGTAIAPPPSVRT
jgi:hypothetical protein